MRVMKKLMQTLMIFIAAALTLLTVAAWGQNTQIKNTTTSRLVTMRVTVAELYDFEEYGSNDVPMDFVIGELKSAKGLSKAEVKELKSLLQIGFVLMHQKNVNACADGYLVMDLDKTFDNYPRDNDLKLISENSLVVKFTCNRK
jgi:hypothetical protein